MTDLVEVLSKVIVSTTEYVGSEGITNPEEVARACLAAIESAGYLVIPAER